MFPSASTRLRTWASTAVDVADAILTAQPPAELEPHRETPDLHAAIHHGSRPATPAARRRRRPSPALPASAAPCSTPQRSTVA